MYWSNLVISGLGDGDRKISWVHWLASLVKYRSLRPVKDPVSRNKVDGSLGMAARLTPSLTHIHAHLCIFRLICTNTYRKRGEERERERKVDSL